MTPQTVFIWILINTILLAIVLSMVEKHTKRVIYRRIKNNELFLIDGEVFQAQKVHSASKTAKIQDEA